MDPQLILNNLLNPPILFFFLGMAAVLFRSDLDIPQPFPKVLSLYLLFAIGFKGGVELNHSGLSREVAWALGLSILMAVVVPLYCFAILRWKLDAANAAAIAATYGSISAVTFITAASYLEKSGIGFSGHLVAAMALMESPAIIVGVLMLRLQRRKDEDREENGRQQVDWKNLGRDAFFNGSVFLLVGSLVIGAATGNRGWEAVSPFTESLFKGVLCLFLLDMGIVATRRLGAIRKAGGFLVGFSILIPLFNAMVGIALARLVGMSPADALMFTVLCAGASYIAVPAAMRLAVPEANPSLYVTMSLALTFPFNIIVGIPLYYSMITWIWG